MLNKNSLIMPLNEYVSFATFNLDYLDRNKCIDEQIYCLYDYVEKTDIVTLQGYSSKISELSEKLKLEFGDVFCFIKPIGFEDGKDTDFRIPITLISKNKLVEYKALPCGHFSEYCNTACTYGVAELDMEIKVRILNMDCYSYVNREKKAGVDWLWDRGVVTEVENIEGFNLSKNEDNIFVVTGAFPRNPSYGIDDYMVSIAKTNKNSSISQLYINKHAVFSNIIIPTDFYGSEKDLGGSILGCDISENYKVIL